ncbi:hypothetical protein [Amycolatopsis sp. EV170708-02-1]|uniref:hypothetical protein n=1 Tax=Amycolatopsis sp. EV170708-02-1 TaxID=2919322 RepID=UPI001F0C85FC|nr:hypothetical protein [Amycolatopsis sp. EV170708-02-1]UMP00100.1 hypothetical protein MJQ72_26755 [Amycolatopsis sp. EV170708-02-1]
MLTVVNALWYLAGAVVTTVLLVASAPIAAEEVALLVLYAVLAVLLLIGGILLFARKPAGRVLVIIGSGTAAGYLVLAPLLSATAGLHLHVGVELGGYYLTFLLALLPAIATLVLALVKPTAVWVKSGAHRSSTMPGAAKLSRL